MSQELARRTTRAPHLTKQNETFHRLARSLGQSPQAILQQSLEAAMELCDAGSAGISVAETSTNGASVFRWIGIAGKLEPWVGECIPREGSPCGLAFTTQQPQLFCNPRRYFLCYQPVDPVILECLVTPFNFDGRPVGALWVVSHREQTHFDMEDVRVLEGLGGFVGIACKLLGNPNTDC